MIPFRTSPLFSNMAQRALHFLSARCSSFSRELLKVSLAETACSFIRASTSSASASPKPTRPPPQMQSQGAP